MSDEPSLNTLSLSRRYNLFPIQDVDAYNFYLKLEASFWVAEEVDFDKDTPDYNSLKQPDVNGKNARKKLLIDKILAVFAPSDGIIGTNIIKNFLLSAETYEEQMFYAAQLHNELIHSITYSMFITTWIKDPEEQKKVLTMVDSDPAVNAKAVLNEKYMNANISKVEKYVAYAAAEGIQFCVLFNIIFWFRSTGTFTNFIFSNELISRDESLHRDFGCNRFTKYKMRDHISQERVIQIIQEYVDVEKLFIKSLIPEDIDDLTQESMLKYLLTVADNLIVELGFPAYYKSTYAPSFMSEINLEPKGNFYEVRIGNYKRFDITKFMKKEELTNGMTSPTKDIELDPTKDLDLIDF